MVISYRIVAGSLCVAIESRVILQKSRVIICMPYDLRYKSAKRVTLVGIVINILLSVAKLVLGVLGHSHGLVADGVHSVADIFTDLFVLLGAKASNQAPDRAHPYGHGRIETVFALLLATLLIVVAVGIGYDALTKIFNAKQFILPNPWLTLTAAIFSVLANEFLFYYTLRVGKQIASELLLANAWHHRSDSLSSFVVCIGIVGSLCGFHYLDAVAAIIVALLIIQVSICMIRKSIRELIDTSVENKVLACIVEEANQISGVKSTHKLRSRSLGGKVFLDVHIQVDSTISVSEGHYIADLAHGVLMKKIPKLADIVVHVDVEDDGSETLNVTLPGREKLFEKLKGVWERLPGFSGLNKMYLHYLNGNIVAEIFLPLTVLDETCEAGDLISQYQKAVREISSVSQVKVYFYK